MAKAARFLPFLIIAFAALPAAADSVFTLGVHRDWDSAASDERFAKARIAPQRDGGAFSKREVDRVIQGTIAGLEGMVKREGAKTAWDSVLKDVDLAQMDFADLRARLDCHYWENGIERRDDLAFVSVCFAKVFDEETDYAGEERQMLVAPFFRSDKVSGNTVQRYLTEAYGEPLKDVPDWRVAKFMGVLPVKYIFVPDLPEEFKRKYSASAMAVYFDVRALEGIQSDQD